MNEFDSSYNISNFMHNLEFEQKRFSFSDVAVGTYISFNAIGPALSFSKILFTIRADNQIWRTGQSYFGIQNFDSISSIMEDAYTTRCVECC